ncbi:MAG: hypothetical protein JWM34_2457 [Ilumatobacteraceae bacterium]|nr:hypothetical protein [Ilumatobacteraceae bacterium]
MTDIVVRKVVFDFPDDLDDVFPGDDIVDECYLAAFSLTMPTLEPFLIRVYRSLGDRLGDTPLGDDLRGFIAQEAQHHRNHARVNKIILSRLPAAVAAELQSILDELDRDYRRYDSTKSERHNLVYAEGFEAMTCAMVLSYFDRSAAGNGSRRFGPWQQLFAWHGAEEVEHRTVAFSVYERLVGSYPYRVYGSLRTQIHFSRYLDRLQRVLLAANGRPRRAHLPAWLPFGWRRYARTFRPSYDPGALEPGALVEAVLAMYSPAP